MPIVRQHARQHAGPIIDANTARAFRLSLRLTGGLLLASGLMLAGCASSESADANNTARAAATVTPVNQICPIGQEPITEDGGSLIVGDTLVAFCCAGCQDYFAGLPAEKQAEFVNLARQGREGDFES